MASCGSKKSAESNSEAMISEKEVKALEAAAEKAAILSEEIEQSAQELDDLLNELENTEAQ